MSKMVLEIKAMCELERKKLLSFSQGILPYLTPEDILQPQDFPELDQNPEFRFREGVCIGLETALACLYAIEKEEKRD